MKQRIDYARNIAQQAGQITLRYFYHADALLVEDKEDQSPVTIADRETELFLRQAIQQQFPDDGICGEEFPDMAGSSGYQWYIDPIDGTKSFIHGVPLYSTLIGLTYEEKCVAGVIALPALGELVWACQGMGTWLETGRDGPRRCRVSACANLAEATLLTSEVATFDKANRRHVYDQLEKSVKLVRTWGDGYGYVLVATGRAGIMLDPVMSDWDSAPLQIILEEAGGRFTDWQGNATPFGKEGLATNGLLHDGVLGMLR